jgi:hypothetical protein
MPATVVRAIRVRRAMRSPAATSRLISRPASRSITTKTARGTRKGAERRARRLFFAYRPTACAAGSSDERRFTMSGATTVGGSSVTRSFSPRGVISNMRRRQQQCRDNLSATPARGICISCHAGSVPHIAQSTLALALQNVFLGTKPPRIGKVPDRRHGDGSLRKPTHNPWFWPLMFHTWNIGGHCEADHGSLRHPISKRARLGA